MALAPATSSKRIEDERTEVVIRPFVSFFDLSTLPASHQRDQDAIRPLHCAEGASWSNGACRRTREGRGMD